MKKDIKKTTKKVAKKEFKPAFTVDLTNMDENTTVRSLYKQFGLAKQKAGLAISDTEFNAILDAVIDVTEAVIAAKACSCINAQSPISIGKNELIQIDFNGNIKIKKVNIFKRFWNWLKRK